MKFNAETDLYGIFGNPVHHSLSPLIHNAVFQELKLNAVYLAFEIRQESLGLAFEAIRSLGIKGVNVTIPFKEQALSFVDEIPEDLDRCVGALNTIVNRNGRLFGYNTDVSGFLTAIREELGFNPQGKTGLVLGAGGAARGVVFALAHAHAEKILIHNRTQSRGQGLQDYASRYFPETEIDSTFSTEDLRSDKIDLVVNATSCGMAPPSVLSAISGQIPSESLKTGGGVGMDCKSPLDLRRLGKVAYVYDLVYTPTETPFLKQAKELRLPCANGIGMLATQAALSFELWTGQKDNIRSRMLEALKKCQL